MNTKTVINKMTAKSRRHYWSQPLHWSCYVFSTVYFFLQCILTLPSFPFFPLFFFCGCFFLQRVLSSLWRGRTHMVDSTVHKQGSAFIRLKWCCMHPNKERESVKGGWGRHSPTVLSESLSRWLKHIGGRGELASFISRVHSLFTPCIGLWVILQLISVLYRWAAAFQNKSFPWPATHTHAHVCWVWAPAREESSSSSISSSSQDVGGHIKARALTPLPLPPKFSGFTSQWGENPLAAETTWKQ